MTRPNHGLFLPIEIMKREYAGKLLLAVETAARGLPVFLGHKTPIIRLALQAKEPGLFLGKGARGERADDAFVSKMREKGHALAIQDEEAGIIFDDFAAFYRSRKSLQTIGSFDHFYCWGEDDFRFLSEKEKESPVSLFKTGSPRVCFWGDIGRQFYREQIEALRKKHGAFILFVSNFASGNSYLPPQELLKHAAQYAPDEAEKQRQAATAAFDLRLIPLFAEAAGAAARQTGQTVVIRPHPTENVQSWRELVKNKPGVAVETEGDLSPWVLAATSVVQNGCTSAIEAAAANVPTLALGETEKDVLGVENRIPNLVALPAYGINGLLARMENLADDWALDEQRRAAVLKRKVQGAGTLQPVHAIADAVLSLTGEPDVSGNAALGADSWLHDLRDSLRLTRFRKQTKNVIMERAKRPAIKKDKFRQDVAMAAKILGRDAPLIERVGPSAYRLRKRER